MVLPLYISNSSTIFKRCFNHLLRYVVQCLHNLLHDSFGAGTVTLSGAGKALRLVLLLVRPHFRPTISAYRSIRSGVKAPPLLPLLMEVTLGNVPEILNISIQLPSSRQSGQNDCQSQPLVACGLRTDCL